MSPEEVLERYVARRVGDNDTRVRVRGLQDPETRYNPIRGDLAD